MLLTQTFSAEDYFVITEKWGNHFEYVNGLVYWKHDPHPLDTETLVKILEANDNAFDFLPPTLAMPTKKHDRLIANLQIKIGIRLQNTRFFAYSQAPNVKIQEDDSIDILGLPSFTTGVPLTVVLNHKDGSSDEIKVNHTYNEQQIEWFKAGAALNIIRQSVVSRFL